MRGNLRGSSVPVNSFHPHPDKKKKDPRSMQSRTTNVLSPGAKRLIRWSIGTFTLLATALLSYSALAQQGSVAAGLNGWLLGAAIFTVLASGLYLQSTRRRLG
jgi:hypothetical protein